MAVSTPSLHVLDYVVAVGVLIIPLAIGFVIASREAKKMTRTDYLLGGKQMTLLPVAMSLFITFQSAVALLGFPSEVYRYGTGMAYSVVGYTLCYFLCYFTFVPLMYSLEVTSIYEYLDLRYRSQTVRMFSTTLGCLQTVFYLAIALLSPSLALQAVGGMPLWVSVLVVGLTGTVYTCVGGIKSVIWTDVFQTVILYLALFTIVIKGSLAVGGLSRAWDLANEDGRVVLDNFSADPRVRMTFWGASLGGFFTWLSTCYNQSTLQRIRSLRSMREAKLTLLANIPLLISFYILLTLIGIVTYAYFDHMRCDAYEGNLVQNANQASPYFVLHAMNDLPGIAGLYMAMLFSGSLSTLSSGINALAANTVEDFLQRPLQSKSERTITKITKVAAAFFGVLICFMAYGAQYLDGPVTQMVGSIYGSFGSPILGMFLIGCVAPWANSYGALAGGVSSLVFTLWLNIGGLFYGRKIRPLMPAPTDQCSAVGVADNSTSAVVTLMNASSSYAGLNTSREFEYQYGAVVGVNGTGGSEDPYAFGFFMNDISYEWYSAYGAILCFVVGLAVSYVTRSKAACYDSPLVFPICRRFWSGESSQPKVDDLTKADVVKQCNDTKL